MDTIYSVRQEKTRRLVGNRALLLTPSSDLFYLTGFRGHISERLCCFALTSGASFLVYPSFEENYINEELRETSKCIPWEDGDDPFAALEAVIEGRDIVVGPSMSAGTLLGFQRRLDGRIWSDAAEIMGPLRMIKDDGERALLEEAQLRAGRALEALYDWGIEGKTEEDAAARLSGFLDEQGLDRASWGPVVASGPNGASPHHVVSKRIIREGDPVVIDFGGVYHGYQADMTRTPVAGRASPEFRAIYNLVLEANEAALGAAMPGVPAEAVDRAAREVFEKAGYGERFTHRLGHGIGLDVHEEPYLVKGNTTPLRAGMCFSDEPGLYFQGKFGVRVEDILFTGEDRARRLGVFPRELREI